MAEKIFDEELFAYLKSGPKTDQEIRVSLDRSRWVYATLDKKLQQLKIAGQIEYIDQAWQLTNMVTCPCCKGRGLVAKERAKLIKLQMRDGNA